MGLRRENIMNYYFLLEDEKSFIKVLPQWLKIMKFPCERVVDISKVKGNHYVMQSGQGVTQLVTKALFDTIETINVSGKAMDALVVILDAENMEVEERKHQVWQKIHSEYPDLSFQIKVFVCNRCFESWLLGKKDLLSSESVLQDSDFYDYYNHYNVSENDPERMLVPIGVNESIGRYHFHYLHELFRYKGIRYSKKKPQYVASADYYQGIIDRAMQTNHLTSFREFYEWVKSVGYNKR